MTHVRENLVKKYRVSEALDELEAEVHKKGGPNNIFAGTPKHNRQKTIESDIKPYIPRYKDNAAYRRIKSFQRDLQRTEHIHEQEAVKLLRKLITRLPPESMAKKAIMLREKGLTVTKVTEVLGISKDYYKIHCKPFVRFNKKSDLLTVISEIEDSLKDSTK